MNNTPQKPQNTVDLKKLLQQYDKVLTPQNKRLINELIEKLDSGCDQDGLKDLAQRMQRAAKQTKK
jgi:hypothetical protein